MPYRESTIAFVANRLREVAAPPARGPVQALSPAAGHRISAAELATCVARAVTEKRTEYAYLPHAQIFFSVPGSLAGCGETACDFVELGRVIRALIDKSVASLGGGVGVVRLALRVGVGSLAISIEDNGRGFSEDMIRRAREKAGKSEMVLVVERARRLAYEWGGRAQSCARLGAGARVDIELPRQS
jgi:signal transduction histidine kinase